VRLAFLSPLPPAATGIADYAADVLALIAASHEIDVFHAQESVERSRLPPRCDVLPVKRFLDRHRERPYDAAVYQMGNGPAHAFLYDVLSRVPGLLVLHDLVLHHSRAAHFLGAEAVRAWRADPGNPAAREAARPWLERWRDELCYTYPERGARLFEVHLGTQGPLLPYAYPLLRIPVEASRLVGSHSAFATQAVRAEVPEAEIVRLAMPAEAVEVDPGTVRDTRRRLGFADGDVVVGSFGFLTPEKRIETVARAVARVAAEEPRVCLLLAGPVPDQRALVRTLERLGMAGRTVVTGRLPFEELPAHMEAADIVVHLRYPTARETSAALLRVLAQGRPVALSDLEHQAGIPAEAVLRIDVADEEDEVRRAVSTLAANPERRRELGRQAAAYVRREHSLDRARQTWEDALERTRGRPDPPPRSWPLHWPRPEAGGKIRPSAAGPARS
jgi:glycosyltransferase involved in cell wall biosynthesis